MKKKQFLTEENYERTKKKLTKLALTILIVGLALGIGLILLGVISKNNAKKTNEERYNEASIKLQEILDAANARLIEIDNLKADLNNKIQTKEYECASLDMGMDNWFAESTKCSNEKFALESELSALELEKFKLENEYYTVNYEKVSDAKAMTFYGLGGVVIIFTVIISLVIFIRTKRRDIMAFSAQEVIPLATEGYEKVAPEFARVNRDIMKDNAPVYGEMTKEIAQGIKEGINNANNNNNNK